MEEILSSIRPIILSDGEEGEAAPEATTESESVAPEDPPVAEETEDDSVLELTERVDEPEPEPDPEPEP